VSCLLIFSKQKKTLQSEHEALWIKEVELMKAVLEHLKAYRDWDDWVNYVSYELIPRSTGRRWFSCAYIRLDRFYLTVKRGRLQASTWPLSQHNGVIVNLGYISKWAWTVLVPVHSSGSQYYVMVGSVKIRSLSFTLLFCCSRLQSSSIIFPDTYSWGIHFYTDLVRARSILVRWWNGVDAKAHLRFLYLW
jgi:hypothetical protein